MIVTKVSKSETGILKAASRKAEATISTRELLLAAPDSNMDFSERGVGITKSRSRSRLKVIAALLLVFVFLGCGSPCWATAPGVTSTVWVSQVSMASMGSTSFGVQANPVGGVSIPSNASGTSATIVSGLPSGITATVGTPSINAWDAVMWNVTLTGSVNAMASSGALNMTLQITDAKTGNAYSVNMSVPLVVTLTPAKLSFSSVDSIAVKQGQMASQGFSFTTGGSFQGPVSLSVTGMPSFVNYSWTTNPVTIVNGVGSSTLILAPTTTATVNWFKFTVTASGDGLSVSQVYTVEVKPTIGMAVSLSAPVITIASPGTATVTVTATPENGIQIPSGANGSAASITSALPSEVTASWSAPTVNSAGAAIWTLTLNTSSAAEAIGTLITLTVQITDLTSGAVYCSSQSFTLLVSLIGEVSVGDTPGQLIPVSFMGLSHEWGDAERIMGYSAQGTNTIYRQLLSNLTAYGSGPMNLRIGGNTTDLSGEPTASTIPPMAELAAATGAKFELGVNLGSSNLSLATDQATAFMAQMPASSVQALEIGNEPDLYSTNGLRPATYDYNDYSTDFYNWKQAILPLLPTGTKLVGPAWAFTSTLSTNSTSFIYAFEQDLTLMSQHFYVTSPSANPAADFLLTPGASTLGPTQIKPAVAQAHASNTVFRLGETGAISNGGVANISNTFEAALWSVDTMFEYANIGVDGVNWEASTNNYNNPFTFTITNGSVGHNYALASVNPLYYGLLFFQAATANASQILPVSLSTSANLKAWAVLPAAGSPHVVVINKDETKSGNVSVNMPGYNHATVLRLTAPSYASTSGITFAGQTFDGSTDGTIQGTQTTETIEGINGVFQVPMAVTSAAIVILTQ